eukprot:4637310-Alexandrium_andersonii.AAC.1
MCRSTARRTAKHSTTCISVACAVSNVHVHDRARSQWIPSCAQAQRIQTRDRAQAQRIQIA